MSELPLYRCHKVVRAAKIVRIEHPLELIGQTRFELKDGLQRVVATSSLDHKPTPSEGWYYVEYDNGYTSFSPADAFEGGYTKA